MNNQALADDAGRWPYLPLFTVKTADGKTEKKAIDDMTEAQREKLFAALSTKGSGYRDFVARLRNYLPARQAYLARQASLN